MKSKEKPIALLIGDAGYGKSVILKDLWLKLQKEEETVALGLKADGCYVTNLTNLEQQLGVGDNLEKMVTTLTEDNNKVVILIDQIDALSLSLSVDHSYLNTYKLLVRKLQHIPNVRIVISVRTYDLNYDPELNFFGNDKAVRKKEIKVGKLTEQEVVNVLRLLDKKMGKLPQNLLELLQIPLHLNVFAKIYQAKVKFGSLRTLQDLYRKLWKMKLQNLPIQSKATSEKCIALAYQMVKGIEITVAVHQFEDQYYHELDYLKSAEIVYERKGKLQFFHQTFFDHVFAKRFIQKKKSIPKFLRKHGQGLLVRAKLKMIINYLRESNEKEYLKVMGKLLVQKDIRFHIKHLLISLLGFRNHPSRPEIKFAFDHLLDSTDYKNLFLEMVWGNGWLSALINEDILDGLLESEEEVYNLWFSILVRRLPEESDLVLDYLVNQCPDFKDKSNYIWRLLYNLEKWDSPLAKQLFQTHKKDDLRGKYIFIKILENAAKVDFDWAIENYKTHLLSSLKDIRKQGRRDEGFSREDRQLIKHFFDLDAIKSFWFYLEILEKLIEQSKVILSDKPTILYHDFAFSDSAFSRERPLYEYHHICIKLVEQLKEEIESESALAHQFIKENINNNSETTLRLLAIGLAVNPKPFINSIFEFLLTYEQKKGFSKDNNLNYYIRELLTKSYPHFSKKQKKQIRQILLQITCDSEGLFHGEQYGNEKFGSNLGLLKFRFLEAIPENSRNNDERIRRKHLELERKFQNLPERKYVKSGNIISKVPGIARKEQLEKFSITDWENSFLKYGENYERDMFRSDPSRGQHADNFKERVEKRPVYFYPFIERLIEENKVWKEYLIRGLQGLESGKIEVQKFIEIYEKAIVIEFDEVLLIQFIQMSLYFIKEKRISRAVFDFLVQNVLHHPSPYPKEEIEAKDPLRMGSSGVRGTAVKMITNIYFDN